MAKTQQQNGTVLPASVRETYEVKSTVLDDIVYIVGTLSYKARTAINKAILKSRLAGVSSDEFRQAIRQHLALIADDESEHERILDLLETLDTGVILDGEDKAFMAQVERKARFRCDEYAALIADQYEYNRQYNWLVVQQTLVAIEGVGIPWLPTRDGTPSDATIEAIPTEDFTAIVDQANSAAVLRAADVKN